MGTLTSFQKLPLKVLGLTEASPRGLLWAPTIVGAAMLWGTGWKIKGCLLVCGLCLVRLSWCSRPEPPGRYLGLSDPHYHPRCALMTFQACRP